MGCSVTYGEELANPLRDSWPSVLGRMNSWSVINAGKPRSSNDRIVRVVMENMPEPQDLLIVAWSQISRFEIFENANASYRDVSVLCPTVRKFKWAEEYYKHYYNEEAGYAKWLRSVVLLQSYLETSNQPYVFCSTFPFPPNLRKTEQILRLESKVNTRYFLGWQTDSLYGWATAKPMAPNYHPLEEGHGLIASRINDFIRSVF